MHCLSSSIDLQTIIQLIAFSLCNKNVGDSGSCIVFQFAASLCRQRKGRPRIQCKAHDKAVRIPPQVAPQVTRDNHLSLLPPRSACSCKQLCAAGTRRTSLCVSPTIRPTAELRRVERAAHDTNTNPGNAGPGYPPARLARF